MPTLLELVVDRLDADLARRRRELSDLRLLAQGARGTTRASLCRTIHLSAYAHWEGFTKDAINEYLRYLCDSRKPTGALRYELRALHFSSMIRAAAADDAPTKAIELIREIEHYNSPPAAFSLRPQDYVTTGNLMSKNLRSLLGLVGLTYLDLYATRENFIDQVLCGRRHRIGHGGLEPIGLTELLDVVDGVISLCEELNQQLQRALIYDEFMEGQVSP